MSDITLSEQLRWIGSNLPDHIDKFHTPEPEEVFFAPFYDPELEEWGAQIGANYGGWLDRYDQLAQGPVYLGKRFTTIRDLAVWMIAKMQNE